MALKNLSRHLQQCRHKEFQRGIMSNADDIRPTPSQLMHLSLGGWGRGQCDPGISQAYDTLESLDHSAYVTVTQSPWECASFSGPHGRII